MAESWGCGPLPAPTLSLQQCWNVLEALVSFFFNKDLEMSVGVKEKAGMGFFQAPSLTEDRQ